MNTREIRRTLVLCSVCVLFLTATLAAQMAPNAQQQPAQAQTSQGGREVLGSSGPAQNRIARELRHQLLLLPYYNVFDWLEFKVQGDKVTLMGEVTSPTIKSDAESAARQVEGVETLDNRIDVLPPSTSDDQLRRAEFRAIYGYDSLSRYGWGPTPSIHIIVRNGNVTLQGVVDSQTDKDTAGIRAKTVPGVFSVTNNLVVGSNGS